MDIEQRPPKSPNFKLIVYIFGGSILAIFAIALLFLHFDRRHITFRSTTGEHSRLTLPCGPATTTNA